MASISAETPMAKSTSSTRMDPRSETTTTKVATPGALTMKAICGTLMMKAILGSKIGSVTLTISLPIQNDVSCTMNYSITYFQLNLFRPK